MEITLQNIQGARCNMMPELILIRGVAHEITFILPEPVKPAVLWRFIVADDYRRDTPPQYRTADCSLSGNRLTVKIKTFDSPELERKIGNRGAVELNAELSAWSGDCAAVAVHCFQFPVTIQNRAYMLGDPSPLPPELITGPRGKPGKSAYEYAKENGYTGTEEAFGKMFASNVIEVQTEDIRCKGEFEIPVRRSVDHCKFAQSGELVFPDFRFTPTGVILTFFEGDYIPSLYDGKLETNPSVNVYFAY